MDFGDQLRAMRSLRDVSQIELAKRVGVHSTYISLLERKQALPTPETRERIMRALDWPEEAERAFAILKS